MLIHIRRLLSVLLAAIVVAVLCTTGPAQSLQRSDGNDTLGPLDLSKVSLTVKHHRFVVKAKTYQAWSASDLLLASSYFGIDIRFGTHWRGVLVGARNGKLAGAICTYHISTGKLNHCNSKVKVTKVDAKTIKAVFEVSAVHRGIKNFRFSIGSLVTSLLGCPAPLCEDRVPNDTNAWLHGHT